MNNGNDKNGKSAEENMRSILFDDNGQPVFRDGDEVCAAEEEIAADAAASDASRDAKAPHGKAGAKELKEKITELGLEIEVLKAELENAKAETETYIALAQRAKADFDNYKKRSFTEAQRTREDGLIEGITKVLPVYDAVWKAFSMITDESTLKGLGMILKKLDETFKETGVEKIDSLGQDFDPELHNAVMNEDAESDDIKGKITEVFQEGFKMGGRVLRYAMVKVAI